MFISVYSLFTNIFFANQAFFITVIKQTNLIKVGVEKFIINQFTWHLPKRPNLGYNLILLSII